MKESFYFPHDYNAFNDEKIVRLRRKMGLEGYGIFWVIVERLAASSEGRLKLTDIEDIAFDMHMECERIASVVHEYNLFKFNDTHFWSTRLLSFFAERESKSDKAKKAAKVRWSPETKENANAMHTQCEGNTIKERKGNKGKEIKERKGADSVNPTPRSQMEVFIKSVEEKNESYMALLLELSTKAPQDICARELDKFISYWTEYNGDGTRQRWQSEKFFDVKRRLATWFSRVDSHNQPSGRVSIIS